MRAWLRELLSPGGETEGIDDESWLAEVLDEIRACEWRIQILEIEIEELEREHERLTVPTEHLPSEKRIALLNLELARRNMIERKRLEVTSQQACQREAFGEISDWLGE